MVRCISASRVEVALVALLLFAPCATRAQTSWDDAIRRVEVLRDEMNRKADALGYPISLGTALNEYHVVEHTCAILGRMLGKADLIGHLEEFLPETSDDGHEFRLAALSLENWLHNARRIQAMAESRQVRTWNLDCVDANGIPASTAIPEDNSDAFYDLRQDGTVLHILGAVTVGFHERFLSALEKNPQVTVVALGSGGGLVREALLVGLEIRKRRLKTTLWNNCYSACPLVFIAGTERTIWSPYPDLGFHQISDSDEPVPLDSSIYGVVIEYAMQMGVDPFALVGFMTQADPSQIYNPQVEELCEARIATWVQRGPVGC